jgi:hypothetical protein
MKGPHRTFLVLMGALMLITYCLAVKDTLDDLPSFPVPLAVVISLLSLVGPSILLCIGAGLWARCPGRFILEGTAVVLMAGHTYLYAVFAWDGRSPADTVGHMHVFIWPVLCAAAAGFVMSLAGGVAVVGDYVSRRLGRHQA